MTVCLSLQSTLALATLALSNRPTHILQKKCTLLNLLFSIAKGNNCCEIRHKLVEDCVKLFF